MTWQDKARSSGRVKESTGPTNLFNEPISATKSKKKKLKKLPCKALECLICTLRFSLEDILNGTYNLETWICSHCYAEMQQKPHSQSCFGKPTFILLTGSRELGYDPTAKECQDMCPDRVLCKRIVLLES